MSQVNKVSLLHPILLGLALLSPAPLPLQNSDMRSAGPEAATAFVEKEEQAEERQ